MIAPSKDGPYAKYAQGQWHVSVPVDDVVKNLRFRRRLLERCRDEETRAAIQYICSQDFFFWLKCFGWVYEPRGPYVLPFVPWRFQEDALHEMIAAIGVEDVGIEKSRDMGVTWMAMAIVTWMFIYVPDAAIGCMTRNEDLATSNSPKSLFSKIRVMLKNLPVWLRPNYDSRTSDSMLINRSNGSTITASSTTKDSARGDRYLFFIMDEAASFNIDEGYKVWASTQAITNTRIALSTPQGLAGIFADVMRKDQSRRVRKITLHWKDHPLKARGLYTSERGKLRILDHSYEFPKDYPFVKDGRTRSPWYDKEWERNPSKRHIAQEVDIDYGGSGSPFFELDVIEAHIRKYARRPKFRYLVDYDTENHDLDLTENKSGELLIWYNPINGEPPHDHDYVIGCDIATGRGGDGGTNSVATIANIQTGQKVAEYAYNLIAPADFAHLAIAMRKFFHGPTGYAWLIWETNGPGGIFGATIMEHSPGRIFYRKLEKRRTKVKTKEPGWWSEKHSKLTLLGKYQESLKRGYFTNPHESALEECRHYIYQATGSIIHDGSLLVDDPSQAGENHGDRVIADALACRMITDLPKVDGSREPIPDAIRMDPMTMGGRIWQSQRAAKKAEQW